MPANEWTYHLQDARNGAWLSRNLPLEDVEIVDVLTGDNTVTGLLVPEDNTIDDQIEEWGNYLWCEKGGEIRAGGILTTTRLVDDGNGLRVTVEGFTRYLHGQTYGGKFRLWSADPLDCLRELWGWTQARSSSSDLGLVVDGDHSTVNISDEEPPPKPGGANVTYGPRSPHGPSGDHWPRPPRPRKPKTRKPKKRDRRKGETDEHWEAYGEWFSKKLDAWQENYNTLNKGRLKPWRAWKGRLRRMRRRWEKLYGDREPYKLSWWEETDMGEEAARLAQEGGFEWRERHTWSGDRNTVNHRLQLGWPSVGVDKRDDITLTLIADEEGDRLLAEWPEPESGGENYSSHVMLLGAGEGRKTRRAFVGGDNGRLRRVTTLARKKIKRKKRLTAVAREERSYRALLRNIEEVAVVDTTGTLGTLRLGDIISVQITGTYWKSGKTAHKITGRRYRPDDDDTIYLQLERAERDSGGGNGDTGVGVWTPGVWTGEGQWQQLAVGGPTQ